MMVTTSEKALSNRYLISGVTPSDNPLRELNIPEQLVVSYKHFRNHVTDVLQHVNQDFPKMQFEKCLNCWLSAGFCPLNDRERVFNLQFLLFIRAHETMYTDSEVKSSCVKCGGPIPLGKTKSGAEQQEF
jgi:hypothetical protein